MKIESLLLLIVVVEAVWIISSLFGGKEEDKKRAQARPLPRDQSASTGVARPRSAPSNVDRFLEEMNRRRRAEAERDAALARAHAPQTERSPRTPQPPVKRIVIARESGNHPHAVPAERVIQLPTAIADVGPRSIPVVQVETASERIAARFQTAEENRPVASQAASTVPAVGSAAKVHAIPTESLSQTAVREQMLALLKNRDMLRSAILLQEVLGPPLSMRRR